MTNLVRWDDPFAGLNTMHSQLDDMFNNLFAATPMVQSTQSLPAMDVYSDDNKQMVAEIHAPGFDKDDLEVSAHNGVLEIKGEKHEKTEENKDKKRSYMLRESHASFYRRLALPDYADESNLSASFEKGVLRVTIPFKELPQPKKIAITENSKK